MEPLPTTTSALPERAKFIATAGWFILLLSAGSALLPLYGKTHSSVIIGTLLVLAGLTELFAGSPAPPSPPTVDARRCADRSSPGSCS